MIDTLFAGFIHGGAYALVAVGMSLIFGVTNVANFAQGSLVAVGIMISWWLASSFGWGIWATLLVVILVSGLLGLAINALVITPLEGRKPIAALLATIGVSQILDNGLQIIFGSQTRSFPKLLPTYNLQLFGVRFGTSDLVMLGLLVLLMIGLWAFLKYGKAGQAIRATSQDAEAARQMGIPVKQIRHLAFVIGSILAGVSGIFIGLFNGNINPMNGSVIGTTAFVAATMGGLGSIPGAVVGGIALGIIESVGVYLLGDGVRDLLTFGVLIIVLIWKPQGLLGGKVEVETEPLTKTFLSAGTPIRLPKWGNLGLIVLALASPFFVSAYVAGVGTQIVIYAIAAVGLTLISGSAGQTIVGMAGPMIVGAYASALLTTKAGWPFLLALVASGFLAAFFSSLLTFPVWKLSGHYVAIATIAVGSVTVAIVRVWEPLTNGSLGIHGISFPKVFGQLLYTPQMFYLLDLVVLIITLLLVSRIRASHLGRVFEAIGADQEASKAVGIHTSAYKALAFAIAAFFTGLSGSLLAHQYSYIDPTIFNANVSILILTIIVLGGMKSPLGAVIGSIVLIGAPELLRFATEVRILTYGLLLILIILFRPQGLFVRKG